MGVFLVLVIGFGRPSDHDSDGKNDGHDRHGREYNQTDPTSRLVYVSFLNLFQVSKAVFHARSPDDDICI
jgi:hypothetical protein